MAAGIQVSASDINANVGGRAQELHQWLVRVDALAGWWNAFGGSNLLNAPYNMAQADIDNIGSAIANMVQIAGVARGTATQASASDLTVFISRVWGLNI